MLRYKPYYPRLCCLIPSVCHWNCKSHHRTSEVQHYKTQELYYQRWCCLLPSMSHRCKFRHRKRKNTWKKPSYLKSCSLLLSVNHRCKFRHHKKESMQSEQKRPNCRRSYCLLSSTNHWNCRSHHQNNYRKRQTGVNPFSGFFFAVPLMQDNVAVEFQQKIDGDNPVSNQRKAKI